MIILKIIILMTRNIPWHNLLVMDKYIHNEEASEVFMSQEGLGFSENDLKITKVKNMLVPIVPIQVITVSQVL